MVWGAVSALGLAAVPIAAAAQESTRWRAVDASTGQIADVDGLAQLAADFPDSGSVRLRLLNALLEAGDLEGAWRELTWLLDRGHRFGPGGQAQLQDLFAGPYAAELIRRFAVPVTPVMASEVVGEVPAEAHLLEGLSVVRATGNQYLTSVVSRELWVRHDGGWLNTGLHAGGNPSGIAFDRRHGVWVAVGDLGMLPAGIPSFGGLVLLGPSQPDVPSQVSFPAPTGVNLSDLALGTASVVYASDPLAGGIYRLPSTASAITPLVAPGTLRSPQGLAESADGHLLYASDYRYGLAMIDLASGTVSRLPADVPMLLDGIDGLWLHEGELIAIQNGTSPMRIVALRLSADGRRIVGRRVLEQDHPDWTEPLGGSIANGMLYYIANGQWDRFAPGGTLVEGALPEPTLIRTVPLDGPPQVESP
ncbi:hypothetical protein GRI99_11730 [Altererythrobacter buctensis]|uniref:SMP-30/Gluconolactonase/LRE-like region domain-containing protein n=2 Tax=Alteraurantiacibacter buctensis TaxID=1503981 RepID=A0A844Z1H7_9SPHN|nr:hypothetical protein [Alteraurantiacibacter buctensis]